MGQTLAKKRVHFTQPQSYACSTAKVTTFKFESLDLFV